MYNYAQELFDITVGIVIYIYIYIYIIPKDHRFIIRTFFDNFIFEPVEIEDVNLTLVNTSKVKYSINLNLIN